MRNECFAAAAVKILDMNADAEAVGPMALKSRQNVSVRLVGLELKYNLQPLTGIDALPLARRIRIP